MRIVCVLMRFARICVLHTLHLLQRVLSAFGWNENMEQTINHTIQSIENVGQMT